MVKSEGNTGKVWLGKHWLTGEYIRILVADGKIQALQDEPGGHVQEWIAPGLIDLQVNGIHRIDFNDPDTTIEQIGQATRYLQRIGVVKYCPTVVTRDQETMLRCISRIAEACQADGIVENAVIGIHVEGPYISSEDGPRGAHSRSYVRDPDWQEFLEWERAAGGRIAKVTIAPERKGAMDFIRQVKGRGIVVAIGHTAATEEEIGQAVEAGATMSTHLGNGSHPLIRRHPNYIWAQLAEDRLWAGFIADGHHLPPSTLKAMIRAKGAKSILVSDANHYEGYAPGRYLKRNQQEVVLREDGRLHMADTPDILSGAALGLHHGVALAAKKAICSLGEAIQMASLHPAQMMGLTQGGAGALLPGGCADFIRYRWSANQDFEIVETVVNGLSVYLAK
jgi:N-acetylglucosamine-6-phosphate deacetylase